MRMINKKVDAIKEKNPLKFDAHDSLAISTKKERYLLSR